MKMVLSQRQREELNKVKFCVKLVGEGGSCLKISYFHSFKNYVIPKDIESSTSSYPINCITLILRPKRKFLERRNLHIILNKCRANKEFVVSIRNEKKSLEPLRISYIE